MPDITKDLELIDKSIAEVRKLQKDDASWDSQRRDVFLDVERLADQLQVADRSLSREEAVALALEQRNEIYDRAVLMKRQGPDHQDALAASFEADIDIFVKTLEDQDVTEAEIIAKRFEQDPDAYRGLLYRDPTQNSWFQSEVERLAKIDEMHRPPDHTGKKIAADAAGRIAKRLQAEDPNLSDLEAITKAYEQSPDLYMR